MVVEDNKEMMHNIIKLCSDIVKFLFKYGYGKYKNETTKNGVYHPIDVVNGLINIDGTMFMILNLTNKLHMIQQYFHHI